jgi:monofunctional biosynthetic peptidoglycan transglycosylase
MLTCSAMSKPKTANRKPHRRSKRRAAARYPSKGRRIGALLLKTGALLLVFSTMVVLPLRWIDPPVSMMMLWQRAEAVGQDHAGFAVAYRWRDIDQMARYLPPAVLAAEDQKFLDHHGFDFEAIADAVETRLDGGALRGASTISQQVAKNLYLWPSRSLVRKGLEAYFTVLIEALWNKRRILEVYLNIAEFGDGVFGAEAAARRYFGEPATALTAEQSARLAAVLPNPKRMDPRRPGPHARKKAAWIRSQVRRMDTRRVLAELSARD